MYGSITNYANLVQKIKAIFYKPDPVKHDMKRYLTDLDYDWSTFTLTSFIDWLTNSFREQVVLVPCCLSPNVCGAYMISPDGHHLILFDRNLPPVLRGHTILHEIAHLLCLHPTTRLSDDEMQRLLSADESAPFILPTNAPNRNMSSKTEEQEREEQAETLALLIQSKVKMAKRERKLMAPIVYTELVSFWKVGV